MDNQRWQFIKEIFFSALDHPQNERSAFLEQACGGNPTLLQAVEQFLAAYQKAEGFLSNPLIQLPSDKPDNNPPVEISGQIGQYRIIREIGRGGMGAVYLAERTVDFHQQVAIKFIKPGMGMEFIIQRFHTERQILATLEHPHIARLLDGGTTADHMPYLVMEFIEGQPIDRYVKQYQLTIPEQLILFRKVCSAVQYAHRNLIVHRDLKPGNILVTTEGIPKLLDFGIAKLLSREMAHDLQAGTTMAPVRLMTPHYASPEQLRGEAITTTSDVYTLGVILFELLTGHLPYQLVGNSFLEIERAVCEEEPIKPSLRLSQRKADSDQSLNSTQHSQTSAESRDLQAKQLRGDLDTIILKALQKDPRRRYGSVEQFSEDLRRHLEGLPVLAQPDKFSYRASKFVKRNRAVVAVSLLAILALLGGIVATSLEAHRAQTQQAKAERRFNDVRKLAQSLLQEVSPKMSMSPNSLPVQKLLVEKTLEYLDSTVKESDGDPALQRELAMAYCMVGDIEGNPYSPNLGDTTAALQSYRKAQRLIEKLVAADPQNLDYRYTLATCYTNMGEVLSHTGDTGGALLLYGKGLPLHEQVALGRQKPDTRTEWMVLNCRFGNILSFAGQSQAATAAYQKAVQISDRLVAEKPSDENARRLQAGMYQRFGEQVLNTGNPEDAQLIFERSRSILEQLLAQHPGYLLAEKSLNGIYEDIGNAFLRSGKTAEAIECFTKMLRNTEKQLARDPKDTQCWINQASSLSNLAEALDAAGKDDQAIAVDRKTLTILEKLAKGDPHHVNIRRAIFNTTFAIGKILFEGKHYAQAFEIVRKATPEIEDLASQDPQNTHIQADVGKVSIFLGKLHALNGQMADARNFTLRGLAIQKKLADSPGAVIEQLELYAKTLNECEPADLRNPTEAQQYTARATAMKNRRLSDLGSVPSPNLAP